MGHAVILISNAFYYQCFLSAYRLVKRFSMVGRIIDLASFLSCLPPFRRWYIVVDVVDCDPILEFSLRRTLFPLGRYMIFGRGGQEVGIVWVSRKLHRTCGRLCVAWQARVSFNALRSGHKSFTKINISDPCQRQLNPEYLIDISILAWLFTDML